MSAWKLSDSWSGQRWQALDKWTSRSVTWRQHRVQPQCRGSDGDIFRTAGGALTLRERQGLWSQSFSCLQRLVLFVLLSSPSLSVFTYWVLKVRTLRFGVEVMCKGGEVGHFILNLLICGKNKAPWAPADKKIKKGLEVKYHFMAIMTLHQLCWTSHHQESSSMTVIVNQANVLRRWNRTCVLFSHPVQFRQ